MKKLLLVSLIISFQTFAQDVKTLYSQAVEQLKTGKYEEGIKLLDQAIALDKNEPVLWYNRAMAKSMLEEEGRVTFV